MDIDCGSYVRRYLLDAMNSGSVSNATVNKALYRLFRVQMRLGMFDPADKQPYMQIPTSAINTPAHQQLALEASRQGISPISSSNVLVDDPALTRHDAAGEQRSPPFESPSGHSRRNRAKWGKFWPHSSYHAVNTFLVGGRMPPQPCRVTMQALLPS